MRISVRRFVRTLPLLAGVLLSGCFGRAEQNLDLLLGFNALDNALRLPQSAFGPLLGFFARLL